MAVEQGRIEASVWKEVDRVGFMRRVFQARKWYGTDWWLAFLSSVGLAVFVVIAIIPGLFAPYDYNEIAGPSRLAPGEKPDNFILIVPTSAGLENIDQLDDGVERASQSKVIGTFNDPNASLAVGYLQDARDMMIRPSRDSNFTVKPESAYDLLEALAAGEIDAVAGAENVYRPLLNEFPGLEEVGYIGEHYESGFLMGTNTLGYDVYSRLIYGTRTTLIIGVGAALASFLMGVPLGLVSGFIGGPIDRVLTLIMDSLYSFPGLILAIAIAAVLGPSMLNIILAVSVLYVPTYFRIVRGQTLSIKEALYVEAAKSLGASRRVTLYKYVFPNVLASVGVIFSVNVADAILTGAGLSFLGLGLPNTIPDWGVDLARGQEYIRSAWWLVVFPGMAIALVTLCFSLLGESLSEIFNPRLNKQ